MSSSDKGQKRRYSEDEEMGEATMAAAASPHHQPLVINKQHQQTSDMTLKKRSKTGMVRKTPLNLKLATVNKEKLLDVLTSLLDSQPDLKHDMMTYMPAPTIPSAMAVLHDMEKKLWASFPYHKQGPQRDQYTFSRVRESLLDFIDTITQYTHHFVSSPTVDLFRSPVAYMDIDQHNQPQRDLYHDLAAFWKLAIQNTFDKLTHQSKFPSATLATWAKSMAHHNNMIAAAAVHDPHPPHHHWLDLAIQEFNQCYFSLPPHTTATTCHTPLLLPHHQLSSSSSSSSAFYQQHHPSSTSTSSTSPMVGEADFR
ncbi:hypothetical protein BCR42DRAFT_410487 [Absidia repens]|uniref:Tethering factor for nuclear proteasome STS1 n=1 Tax=Absidia repens TaxID=90262 RepID=A0A1X2IP37_9FUNG|nr:hypothetical protein BCR42DRAFT_410487 [Absidia repens]